MATVTISRADGGSGKVPKGTTFKLQASVDEGSPSAWKWKRDGQIVAGAVDTDLELKASDDTDGSYVAIATVGGQDVESSAFPVELGDAPTTPEPDAEPEVPPEFHGFFAFISFLIAAVLGGVVLWSPAKAAWDMAKSDWKGTDGHLQLAATLGVPLTVMGGAAVVAGAWMAAVEWRGRFRNVPKETTIRARGVDLNISETIAAIGKLRGAALVMVVGATLMLGSAWIAKESASQPSPGTTTSQQGTPNAPPPPPPATTPPPPGSGGN